jgi:hypothetical protein
MKRTIIFVRTRHTYDSYDVFWRLVELAGYPVGYLDSIDQDAPAVYITTPYNGETPAVLRDWRCRPGVARVVWWCLERPDTRPGWDFSAQVTEALRYVDAAWVSDRLVASLDPRVRCVGMGSHPGLAGGEPLPTTYDYCHMSYAWGRRADLYTTLRARGLVEGPACWGAERDQVLRTSRLLVNAQQYAELAVVAPLRFALAAAHRIPIVTEELHDPYPFVGDEYLSAPYEGLVDCVVRALDDPHLAAYGARAYQRLCVDWTFRRGVEEAVRQLEQEIP